jgi:hypothetical protein
VVSILVGLEQLGRRRSGTGESELDRGWPVETIEATLMADVEHGAQAVLTGRRLELTDCSSRRAKPAVAAVVAHLTAHERITASDVQALLEVSPDSASTILRDLKERGVIVRGSKHARGRGVFYVASAEQRSST